jgi:hypothetical protein
MISHTFILDDHKTMKRFTIAALALLLGAGSVLALSQNANASPGDWDRDHYWNRDHHDHWRDRDYWRHREWRERQARIERERRRHEWNEHHHYDYWR